MHPNQKAQKLKQIVVKFVLCSHSKSPFQKDNIDCSFLCSQPLFSWCGKKLVLSFTCESWHAKTTIGKPIVRVLLLKKIEGLTIYNYFFIC